MTQKTAGEILEIQQEFENDYPLAKSAVNTVVENCVTLELMPEAVVASLAVTAAELIATMCMLHSLDEEDALKAFDAAVSSMRGHFAVTRKAMIEDLQREAA